MINLDLVLELAHEYGFEVNRVDKGKGGMFYINHNNEEVKINESYFEESICIKTSLSDQYQIYEKEDRDLLFAA